MYLAPWQIFAMGCVCGALITFIILVTIFIRIVTHAGVRVEKVKKEEDNNE